MHKPEPESGYDDKQYGAGRPGGVTSSTTAQAQGRRVFTLAQLIDAFMAAYSGPDRAIGSRLAYWAEVLGERPTMLPDGSSAIFPDEVADARALLCERDGRTYLGRDRQCGIRGLALTPLGDHSTAVRTE